MRGATRAAPLTSWTSCSPTWTSARAPGVGAPTRLNRAVAPPRTPMAPPRFGTFSIVAHDRATGELGRRRAVEVHRGRLGRPVGGGRGRRDRDAGRGERCLRAGRPPAAPRGRVGGGCRPRARGGRRRTGRAPARGRRRSRGRGSVHRQEVHGLGRPRGRERIHLPGEHPVRPRGRPRHGSGLRDHAGRHRRPPPRRARGRPARGRRPTGNAGRRALHRPQGRRVRGGRPLGRPAGRRPRDADRGAETCLQALRPDDAEPRGPGDPRYRSRARSRRRSSTTSRSSATTPATSREPGTR